MAFGDGGGEFAFGVVAVAEADRPPVVDHGGVGDPNRGHRERGNMLYRDSQ
jgi:hypothetical protein